MYNFNPGTTSRCTQRLSTCTARPLTTRFLQPPLWGSFFFLTRLSPRLLQLSFDLVLHRTSGKCSSVSTWTPQSNRAKRATITLFSHSCRFAKNPPKTCPKLAGQYISYYVHRRMSWSLSCLSQRKSWKKSIKTIVLKIPPSAQDIVFSW